MFNIKKIRPMFTGVITTAYTFSEDQRTSAGLYTGGKRKGDLNPYQWVVSVGNTVTGLKEGDIVYINFKRYAKAQHIPGSINDDNIQKDNMSITYEIPFIEVDGKTYLRLQNSDIEFVVEDYDGIDEGGLLE
jgi:hypothetical protein